MEPKNKLTAVQLSPSYREKLTAIIAHHRRTIRGQVEKWIDDEYDLIKRGIR